MRSVNHLNMALIYGGKPSGWLCAYYTAGTIVTTTLTAVGGLLLAGFSARCWYEYSK